MLKGSTIIDIDSILLYLFSEEWADVVVACYEVYVTAEKGLKVLGGCNIVQKFGRHGDKEVNITALLVTITGYRTEKTH